MTFPKRDSRRSIARSRIYASRSWARGKRRDAVRKPGPVRRWNSINKEGHCPNRRLSSFGDLESPAPCSSVANADFREHFLRGAFPAFGRSFHVAVEILAGVFAGKKQITDRSGDAIRERRVLAGFETGVGAERKWCARPMLPGGLLREGVGRARINLLELPNERSSAILDGAIV